MAYYVLHMSNLNQLTVYMLPSVSYARKIMQTLNAFVKYLLS